MLMLTTVKIKGLDINLTKKFGILDTISKKIVKRECIITSALDGLHTKDTIHPLGKAIDIRTRDIEFNCVLIYYYEEIKAWLGDNFDVVLEQDSNQPHIHIEYDPKPKETK